MLLHVSFSIYRALKRDEKSILMNGRYLFPFDYLAVSESASTPTTSTSQVANAPNGGPANQNGDYPMEAVLTLMQLNAGWRQ
jgi:hypothetical protein